MTLALPFLAPALVPVTEALDTLRRRHGAAGVRGLAPGLVVPPGETAGWVSAQRLVDGSAIDSLLEAAERHWDASPHAAAALAWRSYTYWLAMPVALGWATARRVPLTDPADVLFTLDGDRQLLTLGLRRARMAVLPEDPLASLGDPGGTEIVVADSDEELRGILRHTLRGAHLDPLMAQLRHHSRLGSRPLLGSLASAAGHAITRGLDAPEPVVAEAAQTLLATLDVADLVEIVTGAEGLAVQRRTCCLAFTLPEPKVCAGCVLHTQR